MKKLPSSVSFLATFFIFFSLSEKVSASDRVTQEGHFHIVLGSEKAMFSCRMKLGRVQRTAGKNIKKIRIPEDIGPQGLMGLKDSLIPDQTVIDTMEGLFAEMDRAGQTPSSLLMEVYEGYLARKHNGDASKRGRFWIFEMISGKKQLILETAGFISLLEVDQNEHPDADFFLVQFEPLTTNTPVRISSLNYVDFSGYRIGFIDDRSEFNSLASLTAPTSEAVRALSPNAHSEDLQEGSPIQIPRLAYRGSKGPNGTEIIFIPEAVSP